MYSPKRQFGNIGENVACMFLTKHGYEIVERNYLRKWGELDIVARKGGVIHFVEVKSVASGSNYRAEENLHPQKLKRLARVMQTYMLEKGTDSDFQLDLAVVTINEASRTAKCELIENIVI